MSPARPTKGEPRDTKREDRRALVAAGKRYDRAVLAYLYESYPAGDEAKRHNEFINSEAMLARAAWVYAVGRKRASVAYGHRHYAKSRAGAALAYVYGAKSKGGK